MALFPCVVGNHKYAGPQQTAYCAALNGSFAARSKLRLCPPHIEELAIWLNQNLRLVAIGENMVDANSMDDSSCYMKHDGAAKWQLFANVYRRGEPQLDFYGGSCDDHLEGFRVETKLEL